MSKFKPKTKPFLISCYACKKEFEAYRPYYKYCSEVCRASAKVRNKEIDNVQSLSAGTIGALSEMLACAYLIKKGWDVFRALSPSSYADAVAIKNDKVFILEIRTGFYSNVQHETGVNRLRYPKIRTSGKKIVVVTLSDNNVHCIDFEP